MQLETRRELEKAAATPPVQGPPTQAEAQQKAAEEIVNKTQVVRDVLASHPSGLTPAQVWGAVKGKIGRRTYVYSILKRLKDRKQVVEKRGKYTLPPMPKIEEGSEQPTTLQ